VTFRPGSKLVLGATVIAGVGAGAFFWTPVIYFQGLLLLGLLLVAESDRRQLKQAMAGLSVKRTVPTIIGRDMPFEMQLTLNNESPYSITGELRDEVPRTVVPPLEIAEFKVEARESTTFHNRYRIPVRGKAVFDRIWIRLRGAQGYWEAQQSFSCPSSVEVLPETFASHALLQKDSGAELRLLDQYTRTRQHGPGTEFESLSPFRYGDDPRRIDWRASARQHTLVVRRFQIERHRDVMILIDSGRLMGAEVGKGSKLDCAVDSALNLARVVLHSGDRCGIAAYDHRVRGFLPPLSGPPSLRSLVRCIYDLQTEWKESDFTPMLTELQFRQNKRSFLIVISDMADKEISQRLCASMIQLQRRHLVLFVALRTPLLDTIAREPIAQPAEVAAKVVAFRLLRERRSALHILSRGGVHVLDVAPSEVSPQLINQFVELRQQNLL